jgi:hypothetical protein
MPENVRGSTVAMKDVRGVQDILDSLIHTSIHHGDQEEAQDSQHVQLKVHLYSLW